MREVAADDPGWGGEGFAPDHLIFLRQGLRLRLAMSRSAVSDCAPLRALAAVRCRAIIVGVIRWLGNSTDGLGLGAKIARRIIAW